MSTPLIPATDYPAIVGLVVQSLRERKALQQAELAQRIGTSQPTVSRIERGTAMMSLEQLVALARALDSTPGAILTQADRVAERARKRGVHIRSERAPTTAPNGEVLIGAAALLLLVGAVLRRGK